jgi:hypothetical protein
MMKTGMLSAICVYHLYATDIYSDNCSAPFRETAFTLLLDYVPDGRQFFADFADDTDLITQLVQLVCPLLTVSYYSCSSDAT